MRYEILFLIALFLTLLIEVPTLVLLIKVFFKLKKLSSSKMVFVGFVATFSSIPYFWFVFPVFLDVRYLLVVGEGMVCLWEAFVYCFLLKIGFKKAVGLSIFLNLLSFWTGPQVMGVLWPHL